MSGRKKPDPNRAATRSAIGRPLRHERGRFPVVGIGASAGGLEALQQLLGSLPADTGMAFVLVQHLDPKHESLSAEILSRATPMPLKEAKEGVRVERNHVYIIPPNTALRISRGALHLAPRGKAFRQHLVIDTFLQSLAEDLGTLAVAVILSGTGTDGTEGLLSVKASGGITFAQEPKSARFDGMPQAAISSGAVDLTLPPAKIAHELSRMACHLRGASATGAPEAPSPEGPRAAQGPLDRIFAQLNSQCHVDFSAYKLGTIKRRIERRTVLRRSKSLEDYADDLSRSPAEVRALFDDILIHVTDFFRDPEAFDALRKEAYPKLFEASYKLPRASRAGLRVWVPGCSSGEEGYSLAISLLEYLGKQADQTPIQIFGSDISEQAIHKARLGEYPESISKSVSPERLKRFFVPLDTGGYRISKSVRDLCLFSRHDVTRDPPFAKIDLVSCRNLLIYFSPRLQRHVIPIFHYALNPGGILWLGKSETISESEGLFSLIDRANKIYAKKDVPSFRTLRFPASTYFAARPEPLHKAPDLKKPATNFNQEADRAIQAEYPGVLINEEMEILQFRGRTAPFLEPAQGAPDNQLMKMARPELHADLRLAVQEAKKRDAPARRTGLLLKEGHQIRTFNLKVIPIKPEPASKKLHFLLLFEDVSEPETPDKIPSPATRPPPGTNPQNDQYVSLLEQELTALKESQLALSDNFAATQESATAANEELQSANEELQSTNEELETAKEELQSGNEELTTVNDELQSRNLELNQANNDLINLLGSVEIPILMLDNDHRIRRFTPQAAIALHLLPTDVGRPIGDLKLTFSAPGMVLDLDEIVLNVIRTQTPEEIEVQDRDRHWFRLQSRPYRTIDGQADGAVLALVDIDAFKHSLSEVRAARTEAEQANRAKDLFLATLSHELRTPLTTILSWSQMLRSGKLSPEKTKRAAEMIEESGRSQAQLINDLLDVSRIITGKFSLELREVSLAKVARAAIESVRPIADGKAIEIVPKLPPDAKIGAVRGDPARLQQVIWNLLTNAIKFSAPESKIVISLDRLKATRGKNAWARIQVRDTGKGISSEFLPHLFDRFSQEDSSSVRLHGGLGLGLAIVKNLVELQGGTVNAQSPGEKKGAVFTVLLPISSARKSSGAKRKQSPRAPSENRTHLSRLDGKRVLIVDDDAMAQEAFSEILHSFGAKTQGASSVRQALKVFPRFKPHVLVTDIAMPGEDGYALIRKIRALGVKGGGNVPCLALTAFASEEDHRRALAGGFQAHLGKPVDSRELAETVADLARY